MDEEPKKWYITKMQTVEVLYIKHPMILAICEDINNEISSIVETGR